MMEKFIFFNAWDNVSWCQFRFKDAVAEKGESARTHAGAIAQQIKEVLENAGIDPFVYGLLCYDEWGSEKEERATFDIPHPEKLDDNGNVVEKAWIEHKTEILKPAKKAGNKYSLRYIECLSVEAAYQRYRFEKIEKRLSNLEDMVRQIVESIKKQ